MKYGRLAAYHMWSSKLLGVLLAAALGTGLMTGRATAVLPIALWLAVGNESEGFATSVTSVILPAWRWDVPSLLHAVRNGPCARVVTGPPAGSLPGISTIVSGRGLGCQPKHQGFS